MRKAMLGVCAAMLLALTTVTARAADVTGSWNAGMNTPDGSSIQLTFNFKQDGAQLTGTVLGPQGDPIAISDGKVDGNNLSFTVSFNGTTITQAGTVNAAGDEIQITAKSDSGDFSGGTMTLKRAQVSAVPATPDSPQTQ